MWLGVVESGAPPPPALEQWVWDRVLPWTSFAVRGAMRAAFTMAAVGTPVFWCVEWARHSPH